LTGGSIKRVPHQLGASLLVSALVLALVSAKAEAEAVARKCFAEAGSSIGTGRAWGWLGATVSYRSVCCAYHFWLNEQFSAKKERKEQIVS